MKKIIMVTGAMGFIGSNLCIRLLRSGCAVIGVDNLSNPSIDPPGRIKAAVTPEQWNNFQFFKFDVTSHEQMMGLMASYGPSAVVHLAAWGSVPRSFIEPMAYIQNNEAGFLNMLGCANAAGVKSFIYASSSSVYGTNGDEVKVEGKIGKPRSPYALSKLHNEMLVKMIGHIIQIPRVIGLRFFNVYGPGQRHDSQYSAVIPKFMTGEKITIFGDGNQVRDFTFIDDVTFAITGLLNVDEENCPKLREVVNVCSGIGTSLNRLAVLVKNIEPKEIEYVPARRGDVKVSIGSPDRLHAMLGPRKPTPIQAGLLAMSKFYTAIGVNDRWKKRE